MQTVFVNIITGKKYSPLFEFFPIFFGIIVFAIGYAVKIHFTNIAILYDSLKTPWGVITSMFVYDGDGNIVAYALFAGLFMGANAAYDRSIRVNRYLLVICSSIFAAIIANISNLGLYAVVNQNGSAYGQSGIVYGLIGAVTAITLFDFGIYLLILYRRARKQPIALRIKKISDRKSRKVTTSTFVVFTLLFTVIYVIIDPFNFFSVAPGVDSFVHLISFGGGAIASIYILYKYKERLMWVSEKPKKINSV